MARKLAGNERFMGYELSKIAEVISNVIILVEIIFFTHIQTQIILIYQINFNEILKLFSFKKEYGTIKNIDSIL